MIPQPTRVRAVLTFLVCSALTGLAYLGHTTQATENLFLGGSLASAAIALGYPELWK